MCPYYPYSWEVCDSFALCGCHTCPGCSSCADCSKCITPATECWIPFILFICSLFGCWSQPNIIIFSIFRERKFVTLESMLLAESVISFERRFSMCSSCVVFYFLFVLSRALVLTSPNRAWLRLNSF